jgi:hypothetical protein
MGTSLSQAGPASYPITAEDRIERIGQLTTKQQTDALLWLAGADTTDAQKQAAELGDQGYRDDSRPDRG